LSYLDIGNKADAAGIGIPASDISVWNKSIPGPDRVPLFRYQTGSGIWLLLHSGTGLADAGQSGIPAFTKAVQSHTTCWRKDIQTGAFINWIFFFIVTCLIVIISIYFSAFFRISACAQVF
jgi:hypothetical protein